MVSTTEVFTNDSPISTMTSTPVKKLNAQKLLCLFTNNFDVKKMLSVNLELLYPSARQLNMEIYDVHWNKSEKGINKLMNR